MKCVNTQLGWSVTFGSVAMTCRVANNTHTHSQTHTLTSGACIATNPSLFRLLCITQQQQLFEAWQRSFAQLSVCVKERSFFGDDENEDSIAYFLQFSNRRIANAKQKSNFKF